MGGSTKDPARQNHKLRVESLSSLQKSIICPKHYCRGNSSHLEEVTSSRVVPGNLYLAKTLSGLVFKILWNLRPELNMVSWMTPIDTFLDLDSRELIEPQKWTHSIL